MNFIEIKISDLKAVELPFFRSSKVPQKIRALTFGNVRNCLLQQEPLQIRGLQWSAAEAQVKGLRRMKSSFPMFQSSDANPHEKSLFQSLSSSSPPSLILPNEEDEIINSSEEDHEQEDREQEECGPWLEIARTLRSMLSANVFERWFSNAQLVCQEDGAWVLFVPSDTHSLWIEANYMAELKTALATGLDQAEVAQVRIETESQSAPSEEEKKSPLAPIQSELSCHVPGVIKDEDFSRKLKKARLNPVHTFERFVVGGSNEFAHAACLAVAQGRGQAFNPLFIHGESGMGKTHLAQALGQEFMKSQDRKRVVYLTCEQFTNEFIDKIQTGSLTQFRNKYRRAEVLIVDDVQFLKGKEKTGDEFFHTFNELLEHQAQIVLTSDRPASEIQNLESRLITRFQSGLTVALEPPPLEMRVAILQKKMTEWKVKIPQEILVFIAERVQSSVRRLEGALVQVATYSSLSGAQGLTKQRAEVLLQDIIHEEMSQKVTIDSIQRTVVQYYDLELSDMTSRRRPKNIAHARQVAMYLSRKLTKNSLMEIGDAFGGRDHGTIIHAVKKVSSLVETESETRQTVEHLKSRLKR